MRSRRPLLLLLPGCLAALTLLPAADQGGGAERPPVLIDQGLVNRGKPIYERFCISCHGPQGDGLGYSAQWLDPLPRDFTSGIFKCRSTPSGTLPTDEDLMRTVRVGIYHTYMPTWAVLGDYNLRGVIEYIKTFSPKWKEDAPGQPIAIPAEPPDSEESRKRGAVVWANMQCAKCHGPEGKGNGLSVPTLMDDWGHHITPFDFTSSDARKCGNTDTDLYRTFMTGVNGTPMPSFADSLKPEEAWDLVHFLHTLRQKE